MARVAAATARVVPNPAGWRQDVLVWFGLAALVACIVWTVWPKVPKIDAAACENLVAPEESPAGSGLRIVRFGPEFVELGGGVCVVVAGVAEDEPGGAPVELAFYLNNQPWPVPVLAQARSDPQWLLLPLVAPASATDDSTGFWPRLLGDVAWKSSGVRHVVLGVSRKAEAAEVPEATTAKLNPWRRGEAVEDGVKVASWTASTQPAGREPAGGFELRVFSWVPVVLGVAALLLFAAALLAFAARTPLLRDNVRRVRDVFPEELRRARAEVVERKADVKTAPDASARAAAQMALDKARTRERELEAVLDGISPLLRQAETARIEAKAKGAPAQLKSADQAVQRVRKEFGGRAVGSYSLGRTQLAFWLFLITAGYIFVALSIGQFFGVIDDKVVALLGISSATGLGAVLISGDAFKDSVSKGYLHDVLCIADAPQLTRIQTLGWTLILGGVFVWVVVGTYRFPEFDPTLLLLMGLSGTLYLTFKPGELKAEETEQSPQ